MFQPGKWATRVFTQIEALELGGWPDLFQCVIFQQLAIQAKLKEIT